MEALVSLSAKVGLREKRAFVENAEALGMTASGAIKVFARMFNECRGFPFEVRRRGGINYSAPGMASARLENGKLIVPASWHDDDDGYRQGSFANLPMSRWGHRRYRPTSRPPSLRAAIRLGNACGPLVFDYVLQPGGYQHQRGCLAQA